MQTTRTPYSVSFMATVLLLFLFACHSTIANAAVALGATRVIYPANQKQVLLPVTNNDPASVYLIQSWIENAGDQKDTQFVITPPLFSMQGKKENTLRIINATNHQLPGDRESLFWVNVKAIPAMEKDQKNENTLQLAIISRIKMFYRPTHLAMIVWLTHHLSLMLVSNICHSPFRKYMSAEWLAAMFLLICGKKE